jgi:hypothetical protein
VPVGIGGLANAGVAHLLLNRNSSPFPHCSGPFLNNDSPLAMQRPR